MSDKPIEVSDKSLDMHDKSRNVNDKSSNMSDKSSNMSDKPKPSPEHCLTTQDKLVRHVCSRAVLEWSQLVDHLTLCCL